MFDLCDEIVMIIWDDDFYDEVNCKIFYYMMEMYNVGKKIDLILLREVMICVGDYEVCGGVVYFVEVISFVVIVVYGVYYVNIVCEKLMFCFLINVLIDIFC